MAEKNASVTAASNKSAPQTVREVERKFRVHGLFRMPDLTADGTVERVEDRGTATLTATYHDTDDLRLARAGVTLRRREGGSDAGWHLKLPAGGPSTAKARGDAKGERARDEVRMPLDAGTAGKPPAELLDLVTAYVRNAEVRPVATLRTERTTRLLHRDGTLLGELVDDIVSVVDGSHVAARFRELELEAAPEADHDAIGPVLDAVAERLEASGAVTGEFVSKAVRALGPAAEGEADVPEAPAVSPSDPAAAAVQAHLATHVRAFLAADLGVRRDTDDAVHKMRVAARRLRSGLRVFASLVDDEWSRPLRDELKWAATELGNYRDREVLLARLERDVEAMADDPETAGQATDVVAARRLFERHLRAEMDQARAGALAALRSERYRALLDTLVDAARAPHTTEEAGQACAEMLPPLVAKAWRRLAKRVNKLDDDGPDETWHEARIAAKRARYAAEACTPVFGTPAKDLAGQCERVTEVLGEHQDAAVAAEVLHELARGPRVGGRVGFELGVLHSRERAAAHAQRAAFRAIWPEVSRKRWRRWLDGS